MVGSLGTQLPGNRMYMYMSDIVVIAHEPQFVHVVISRDVRYLHVETAFTMVSIVY